MVIDRIMRLMSIIKGKVGWEDVKKCLGLVKGLGWEKFVS